MATAQSEYLNDILSAPDYHLRAVLLALSAKSHNRSAISKHLSTLRKSDVPSKRQQGTVLKDLWICVQCEKAFSSDSNEPGGCVHHPGVPQLDQSADCWMDIYGDEWDMYEDWEQWADDQPEGYRWSCCDATYDAKACKHGIHTSYAEVENTNIGSVLDGQGNKPREEDEYDGDDVFDEMEEIESDEGVDTDSEGGDEPAVKRQKV